MFYSPNYLSYKILRGKTENKQTGWRGEFINGLTDGSWKEKKRQGGDAMSLSPLATASLENTK